MTSSQIESVSQPLALDDLERLLARRLARQLLDAHAATAQPAEVLQANSETTWRVTGFPHAGQASGDSLIFSCVDMGILTSKCLPHAWHSNS